MPQTHLKPIENYGADATRWYMITNASPWDNLKFDLEGITETRNKFFGTLFNTYQFFALYANVDEYFKINTKNEEKTEIDKWIISRLNTLIFEVKKAYTDYEPTLAGRLIQNFVEDDLSNWYVRLCRRRFWKGEMNADKMAAYNTLYTCLIEVSKLMAPIAPFFSEFLFKLLNNVTNTESVISVHLSDFPVHDMQKIDNGLEQKMNFAQRISSMVLSLRKNAKIRVRQPLQKIIISSLGKAFDEKILAVQDLILNEINVKELQLVSDTNEMFTKKAKPNFKILGKKLGQKIKSINPVIAELSQEQIKKFEQNKSLEVMIENEVITFENDDLDIVTEDIIGLMVNNDNELTVALDCTISNELLHEGNAREIINRIQKLRKEKDFELTDRIILNIVNNEAIKATFEKHQKYICDEVLANNVTFNTSLEHFETIELNKDLVIKLNISKA
jgi:isoleucyl-tRNA synthetase